MLKLSSIPNSASIHHHHCTMQQPSTFSHPALTPSQIRRWFNDFDQQVQQGVEDGTFRSVMKRLSNPMVSRTFFLSLLILTGTF
jgi:hypothetical protein